MNPHVTELLAAYHDGELAENRRQQVENHVRDCETCRTELAALASLSSFLKVDAVPPQTLQARFAAQVQLRLPRASLAGVAQEARQQFPRWTLGVPLAMILLWAFLEAALRVTWLILTTDTFFGIAGGRTALFNHWVTGEGFFETSLDLLVFNIILLIGTIILWSAWMAFWLAWNKDQNVLSIKGGVT